MRFGSGYAEFADAYEVGFQYAERMQIEAAVQLLEAFRKAYPNASITPLHDEITFDTNKEENNESN